MAADSLNARQQRFADLILEGWAACRAYGAAGFRAGSDRTAEVEGSKLLRKPEVAAYLAERRAKAAEQAGVSAAEALAGLREIAGDKGQPGQVRVQAHRAILEGIRAGLAPTPFLLQEAEPPSHARIAALAIGVLEGVAAGRLSPTRPRACCRWRTAWRRRFSPRRPSGRTLSWSRLRARVRPPRPCPPSHGSSQPRRAEPRGPAGWSATVSVVPDNALKPPYESRRPTARDRGAAAVPRSPFLIRGKYKQPMGLADDGRFAPVPPTRGG